MKRAFKYFLITLAVIVVDQVVKVLIKTHLHQGEEIPVLGHFFRLHFVENSGAAFGLTFTSLLGSLLPMTEDTGKLILTLFSLVLVGLLGYFLYKIRNYKTALPIFVALILGGALGNIIDRVFYGVWFQHINDYEGGLLHGWVVDMFYFDIWQGVLPRWVPIWGGQFVAFWPIFNVADSAISVGIVTVLIFQKRFFHTLQPKPDAMAPHMEVQPGLPPAEA